MGTIYKIKLERFRKTILEAEVTGVCFQPFGSFTITPEFCFWLCFDYHKALIVGIPQKIFKEICIQTYQEWRQRHIDGKKSICYNCINNTNEPYDSLSGTLEMPLK